MKLRFRCKIVDLKPLAQRYESDEIDLSGLKEGIRDRGYLTKDELHKVARWKSGHRIDHLIARNSKEFVREITEIALGAKNERTRIEILTLLGGVQWPTASVILHFFHQDPYPIIDVRALWTLSVDKPSNYNFDCWQSYVDYCRSIAHQSGLDMRTLDQALWQYSKENRKPT